ncbi:S8 family peptidase [Streptomyces marincola]|uniref:S8 family peptidase n=1 Tax=Streptomyces marincola TaxID=2878388 RepID=UPI001CF388EC|nr:S8 family serine peptidase [Streptomyces marincola]UCM90451.1 S8 family serine peptidase [Streptomyces marincola]
MRRRKNRPPAPAVATLLTAAFAGLTLGASPTHAATPHAPTGGEGNATAADSVLLITGDRVPLDAHGEPTGFVPAEGREGMRATVSEEGDSRFVIPSDAMPLVEQGVVDRRLFDVMELRRPEYDRLADGGLPVVVRYENATAAARGDAPGTAHAELDSLNARALVLDESTASATWNALTDSPGDNPRLRTAAPGVAGIALDAVREALLDTSTAQVGAPAAWEAGFDGSGTRIAVLDTGIDATHPDLAGSKVVAAENFSEAPDLADRDGHGTHVASIAAGTGAHSGGTFSGVAPGAELLNGKVLDDEGFGLESGIVAGMEWAVAQDADIVNLSLGGFDEPGIDPLEEAVNRLSAESDTLFVAASGNSGNEPGGLSSPASAEAALAVGAVDDADALAEFSSVGPGADGGGLVKPDLTAPGVSIGAAAAEGSAVAEHGEPVADGYAGISGTSMAAPHVAGAAALLAQAHPDWDGERIKAALVGSAAAPADGGEMQQGTGRLDVARAIAQEVVAEPVSLDFGTAAWPHEDDEPVTEDLTYRNLGDEDVTLDLALTTNGPGDAPAPEGMFALGADQVTVPAGGTATVPVTADTRHGDEATGHFSFTVTATGTDGTTAVRTAGAVEREAEVYQLAIEVTGDDGLPATGWAGYVTNLDTGEAHFFSHYEEDGPARPVLEVTPGTYVLSLSTTVWDSEAEEVIERINHTAALPDLRADTTLALDNRETEPVDITVFDAEAEPSGQAMNVRTPRVREIGSDIDRPAYRTLHTGPDVPEDGLTVSMYRSWISGENTEYHAAFQRRGTGFTGLDEHVEASELARVEVAQNAVTEGSTGSLWVNSDDYSSDSPERELPATTDLYVMAGDIPWNANLRVLDDTYEYQVFRAPTRTYQAGEHVRTAFNAPVFGPGFGTYNGLFRQGDVLWGSVGLFTDADGNTGESEYTSALSTLALDGEEIARYEDAGYIEAEGLPAEDGRYTWTSTVSRPGPLSSEVRAEFGFDSAHVSPERATPLPLSVVRFTPELAPDGTAPGGAPLRIPVEVQGPAADNLADLTVEVSFDGGETWQEKPVRGDTVVLRNPPADGSVSLRGSLTDQDGGTSTVTVINAYLTR